MRSNLAPAPTKAVRVRTAEPADLDALLALEQEVFATDRLSRRSFRQFIRSSKAELIVAAEAGGITGYGLVLFRPGSAIARLYSIAVAASATGRGIGPALIAAAEEAALRRDCVWMRLEVHVDNARAIARYRRAGYREFGRRAGYYEDGGDALRFEKRLQPALRALKAAPPYRHQTTDFTCGPACILMALAWAEPGRRLEPGLEFRLWREATTIFMTAGHGGCGPFGLAVALRRCGLLPEVYVSKPGPYFLDTVRSEDKRRVMRLTQADFRREADSMGIKSHMTAIDESVLMRAFDQGAVAIVLVAGYQMRRSRVPHWVFAFGHEGHYVLVHDPAARKDDQDMATAAETYAVPWAEFERMTHFGPDRLRATLIVRKGKQT